MQGSSRMNPSQWIKDPSPRMFRHLMAWFPPIRNSGVKVDFISDDWRTWRVRLPLGLRTRNYVGTHYGGTLYSAADPHFMLAWMHILPDHIVWDKAASIRFRKPGAGTLHAEFTIPEADVAAVRAATAKGKHDRTYHLDWIDGDGDVVASVEKVIHFRRKDAASPGKRGSAGRA